MSVRSVKLSKTWLKFKKTAVNCSLSSKWNRGALAVDSVRQFRLRQELPNNEMQLIHNRGSQHYSCYYTAEVLNTTVVTTQRRFSTLQLLLHNGGSQHYSCYYTTEVLNTTAVTTQRRFSTLQLLLHNGGSQHYSCYYTTGVLNTTAVTTQRRFSTLQLLLHNGGSQHYSCIQRWLKRRGGVLYAQYSNDLVHNY